MTSKKKPTIDDVAAYSGVAKVTVSRVLNDGPNVRPEVRERVRKAVAALNYKVNLQARSLASGASQQLTLVHESALEAEPNSYYHSGLELGALRGCAEHGFTLSTLALDPRPGDRSRRLLDLIDSGRADGVILTPPFSDDLGLVKTLLAAGCPIVCVSGGVEVRAITASVGIDDDAAGYAIGRFLVGLGHRRIGYMAGPEGHISASYRRKGLMRAVEEIGAGATVVVERGDFTFRSGSALAHKMFAEHGEITALACANDDMAAGATLSAHQRGLAIPDVISVCGFDDTPVSEVIWPPLTTVHQPIRLLGQRAAEALVKAIQAGGVVEPGFLEIPFRIVERASTAPPRR